MSEKTKAKAEKELSVEQLEAAEKKQKARLLETRKKIKAAKEKAELDKLKMEAKFALEFVEQSKKLTLTMQDKSTITVFDFVSKEMSEAAKNNSGT